MRDLRQWAFVVALAAVDSACNSAERAKAEAEKKEEAAREAQRATKLAGTLKALEPTKSAEDARKDFATMRQHLPAARHADIEQVEKCQLEQVPSARKAAAEKRYQDVAVPLVDCVISMETLRNRVRIERLRALLSDAKPSASAQRETEISGAQLQMVIATLKVANELLALMLEYGPADARLATFQAIAGKLPPADSGGAESTRALLQRGYAAETIKDAKDAMAARLKALSVPLPPASPTPAPAATPATQP